MCYNGHLINCKAENLHYSCQLMCNLAEKPHRVLTVMFFHVQFHKHVLVCMSDLICDLCEGSLQYFFCFGWLSLWVCKKEQLPCVLQLLVAQEHSWSSSLLFQAVKIRATGRAHDASAEMSDPLFYLPLQLDDCYNVLFQMAVLVMTVIITIRVLKQGVFWPASSISLLKLEPHH